MEVDAQAAALLGFYDSTTTARPWRTAVHHLADLLGFSSDEDDDIIGNRKAEFHSAQPRGARSPARRGRRCRPARLRAIARPRRRPRRRIRPGARSAPRPHRQHRHLDQRRTRGDAVFGDLGRAPRHRRAVRLHRRDLGGNRRRAVSARERQQVAAVVDDGNGHVPLVLQRLGARSAWILSQSCSVSTGLVFMPVFSTNRGRRSCRASAP